MMHQENYLIQIMNEDLLDLTWPCCCRSIKFEVASKVVEWGLRLSLIGFAFDSKTGILDSKFRKEHQECVIMNTSHDVSVISAYGLFVVIRRELAKQLRWQFRKTGIFAMILSPFILVVVLVYAFFSYAAVCLFVYGLPSSIFFGLILAVYSKFEILQAFWAPVAGLQLPDAEYGLFYLLLCYLSRCADSCFLSSEITTKWIEFYKIGSTRQAVTRRHTWTNLHRHCLLTLLNL